MKNKINQGYLCKRHTQMTRFDWLFSKQGKKLKFPLSFCLQHHNSTLSNKYLLLIISHHLPTELKFFKGENIQNSNRTPTSASNKFFITIYCRIKNSLASSHAN
jgi:hypothetical protein